MLGEKQVEILVFFGFGNSRKRRTLRSSFLGTEPRPRLQLPPRPFRIHGTGSSGARSGVKPPAQETEFVALWVGQDVPLLVARLPNVGRPGPKAKQPFQLGVLVPVNRVDVGVQGKAPGPGVAARAENDGRLQAAEPGGRADLDGPVLPVELDVPEDLAPVRLLRDVLRPQLRVSRLEAVHHVHASLIIQDHHVNPA